MSDKSCGEPDVHSGHVWDDTGVGLGMEWCSGAPAFEVEEMSHEQSIIWEVTSSLPTKPDACDCGHEGLEMTWHLQGCPVNDVLRSLRAVLETGG